MTIIDKTTEKIEELRQTLPPGKVVKEVWRNKRRMLTISTGDETIAETDFMSSMEMLYWIKGYLARHNEPDTYEVYGQTPSSVDLEEYFAEFIKRTK